MKWNPFLSILIFIFTCLGVGCRARTPAEKSIDPTSQDAQLTPSMTATFRPTAAIKSTEVPATPVAAPNIAATVIAATLPKIHSSFPSADGEWRMEVVIHDCVKVQASSDPTAVEILKLIGVRDHTEMIVESMLRNCEGVGAFGLGGLFWSPNNQYFYYTDAREGVPDGLCGYWARPVKRVNVDTQELEWLGGGHLSPDKTKLAFWRENEIVIWGLDEGEIARVVATKPEAFPNEIAWSPEGQSLVYLQTESDCFPFGKSSITRLDLANMTQSLLLESEEPGFSGLTWDASDQIRLVDDKGNQWRYNLISKELQPKP